MHIFSAHHSVRIAAIQVVEMKRRQRVVVMCAMLVAGRSPSCTSMLVKS